MSHTDEEVRILDEKLRGAGLLEDGLSLQEKRQLCDFLADSCSSAQHEEQKRQQRHHQYEPARQQSQQSSEQDKEETLGSLNIEEVQSSDDVTTNADGRLQKQEPQAAGSSSQSLPRLSQDVDFFDSQKYGSDQSVESLSQSLLQGSDLHLNSKSLAESKADQITSNVEVKQSNDVERYDQNMSSSDNFFPAINLHSKSSEQDKQVLNTSNAPECEVQSGSDAKLPLEDSLNELSINLPNNSKGLDSFKGEIDESGCHLHLDQSNNTTADEQQNRTADSSQIEAMDRSVHSLEAHKPTPVKEANGPTAVKPTVAVVQPCVSRCNGTDASKAGSSDQLVDIYACLPTIERIKLYSKRKDEINHERASLFKSAPPEVQKQILDEVLVSLTKTSNQYSVSAEQPNVPVMWTRVITVVAPTPQLESNSSTVGTYTLRRRRNQQTSNFVDLESVSQDLDDLQDILPDVDVEQRVGNDGDWLPAVKSTTKKKRQPPPAAVNKRPGLFGAKSRERGAPAQVECQESDDGDDDFDIFAKKPLFSQTVAKDNNKPSTSASNIVTDQPVASSSNTIKRKSFSLQIDRALTPSNTGKENQSKFQRSKSPVYDPSVELNKMASTNKDDASSDNDIVEIDVVGTASSSYATNSTPKNHTAATISSSSTSMSSASSRGHVLAAQSPSVNRACPRTSPGTTQGGGQGGSVGRRGLAPAAGGSVTKSTPIQEQRPQQQKRNEEGDQVIKPGPLKMRGQLFQDQAASLPSTSGCGSSSSSSPARSAPGNANVSSSAQAAQLTPQQKRNVDEHRERREQVEQQQQRQQLLMAQKQQQKQEPQKQDDTPEETVQCPICLRHFPLLKVELHASNCDGTTPQLVTTRQKAQHQQGPSSSTTASSSSSRASNQHHTNGVSTVDCDDEIFLNARSQQKKYEASSSGTSGAGPSNSSNKTSDALGVQVEIIGSSGGASSTLKSDVPGVSTSGVNNKRKFADLQQGRGRPKLILADSDDEDDDCVSLPVLENCGITRSRTPEGEMRCYQCLGSVPKGNEYSDHVHFHCPALATAQMIAPPSAVGSAAYHLEQTKPRGRGTQLVLAPSRRGRPCLAARRLRNDPGYLSSPTTSRTVPSASRPGPSLSTKVPSLSSVSRAVPSASSVSRSVPSLSSASGKVQSVSRPAPSIASTSSPIDEADVTSYYRVPDSPPRFMTPASQQTDSCIDYGAQYSKANLPMNASRRGRSRGRGGRKRGRKRKRSAPKTEKMIVKKERK